MRLKLTTDNIRSVQRALGERNPELLPAIFRREGPFASSLFWLLDLFNVIEIPDGRKPTEADRQAFEGDTYGRQLSSSELVAWCLILYDRNARSDCPLSRSEYKELLEQAFLAAHGAPADLFNGLDPKSKAAVLDQVSQYRFRSGEDDEWEDEIVTGIPLLDN